MLLTPFLVLATAGATVDDREIQEQWLIDIADTYNQQKYTAQINVDHIDWWGNYGQVVEVRLGKDSEGNTVLEGVLNPNHYLIELNKDGQKLFMSVEITPNFQGQGKAYLTGLAVTDRPASTGTAKLIFSKQNSDCHYTSPVSFMLSFKDIEEPTEQEEHLFKKFLTIFKNENKPNLKQETFKQEDNEMSQIQLDKLEETVVNLSRQLQSAVKSIADLGEKFIGNQPDENETTKPETEVKKLREEVLVVKNKLAELSEELPPKFSVDDHSGDNAETIKFI
jgi:hypothetical protein